MGYFGGSISLGNFVGMLNFYCLHWTCNMLISSCKCLQKCKVILISCPCTLFCLVVTFFLYSVARHVMDTILLFPSRLYLKTRQRRQPRFCTQMMTWLRQTTDWLTNRLGLDRHLLRLWPRQDNFWLRHRLNRLYLMTRQHRPHQSPHLYQHPSHLLHHHHLLFHHRHQQPHLKIIASHFIGESVILSCNVLTAGQQTFPVSSSLLLIT